LNAHLAFDLLAAAAALAVTVSVYFWRLRERAEAALAAAGPGYVLALVLGAAIGGYGFGTLNLLFSSVAGAGRSILGALAGAILAVEVYKWVRGIKGSTGVIFACGFATTAAVGRIGCFLSGIGDQTHGIATALPWGHDFGDRVLRHPVQLYEDAAMAAVLALSVAALARRSELFLRNGFYLLAGAYAAQRFGLEFLKPYASVIGPLNLFHLICLGLIAYCAAMIFRSRNA
jgi:prolipoprotein diacylglyceryltransferase